MSGPAGDLVLRGGQVLDHASGGFLPGTVRVSDGRITADPGPSGRDVREIDVTGLLVAAGLVDLHAHVFAGQDLGVPPDEVGPPSGVTTIIDAGSTGGHLIDAFRAGVIERSAVRIRPFLNIASIGTTSIRLGGELRSPHYVDEETAVEAVGRHAGLIVGIKVRASGDVGGEHSPEALSRARRVADRVGLPLMVHLGPPPETVDRILDALGPGDLLTHCFTGFAGNTLLEGGSVRPSALAARERGVLFDVGHGQSGFDATVAARAIAEGFPPDTVSTDIHTYSRPLIGDMASVLSRLMAVGMRADDALWRATISPARAVGLDAEGVGTLAPGAPGDVAVFRLEDRPTTFLDGHGHAFPGTQRLVPVLTVLGGRIVHDTLGVGA